MVSLCRIFAGSRHPLGAKAVFSYGMTKCGSTLAFELARSALELSGFPQPHLPEAATGHTRRINFAAHLDDGHITNLTEAIRDVGHPVVIKTHTRPDPCVIDMINRSDAIVQASYRDPRDMALSMLDHGRRSRATGKRPFAELETLSDTIPNIASQIDSLTQWLYRPNCLPLYYQDFAFRSLPAVRRILWQLQLDVPPAPILRYVLERRFTQFNLGLRNRHKKDRKHLPRDGTPILPETVVLTPTPG